MFSADQVMFVFRNQGSKMKKHFISLETQKNARTEHEVLEAESNVSKH